MSSVATTTQSQAPSARSSASSRAQPHTVAEQLPYRAPRTQEMTSRRQFPGAHGLRGADPVGLGRSVPSGTVVDGMITPDRALNERCSAGRQRRLLLLRRLRLTLASSMMRTAASPGVTV